MSAKNKGNGSGRGAGRVKRKQIQSEDGWTVITHGLSNVSLNSDKGQETGSAGSLPAQIVTDLTAGKLLEDFRLLQERWEDTALATQVKEIVGEKKEQGVEEAVCIGIGSFSRDWAHRWRSLWQLVLFVEVVERSKFSSLHFTVITLHLILTWEYSQAREQGYGHFMLCSRSCFYTARHRVSLPPFHHDSRIRS